MKVHSDDLWKLLGVIGGALVFMASGHLPHALLPYKETIETAAFIWTTIQAQRMVPSSAVKESGK
jgi:hypothetical protein